MPADVERYGARTDQGCVRNHNEDAIGIVAEEGLWFVVDGMGGHAGGEQASTIARDKIIAANGSGHSIVESIESAHTEIVNAASAGRGPAQMGSTVVALKSSLQHYIIAWVGDSRAYLWNKKIVQLSKDHSLVQSLVDSGKIKSGSEEAANIKNVITQCLGPPNEGMPRVDTVEGSWCSGDKLLLCSDGLYDEVDDGVISGIIAENESAGDQAIVDALVDAALKAGGSDNITAVIVSPPHLLRGKLPIRPDGKPSRFLLMILAVVAILWLLLFLYENSI